MPGPSDLHHQPLFPVDILHVNVLKPDPVIRLNRPQAGKGGVPRFPPYHHRITGEGGKPGALTAGKEKVQRAARGMKFPLRCRLCFLLS